jgi:tetratricopeptide (TPR) repeat protein
MGNLFSEHSLVLLYKGLQMKKKFKNSADAFKYYASIAIDDPDYAEAQVSMGILCQDKGAFTQAIAYYEKGVKNELRSPDIFYNLAICYNKIDDIDRSIDYFFKAIEEKSDFKEAVFNCCSLCLKRGKELKDNQRVDEAINLYLRCLCFSSGHHHIALLQHLTSAYSNKGDITNAIKCAIRSLELDPMNAISYEKLSRLKKFTDEDIAFIQQMELLLQKYTHQEKDQMFLCWALGKIYDDIKSYNKAFTYYKKANQLYSKRITFNIENCIIFRNKMISIFENPYIRELNRFGNHSKLPVFIVGHNKTGTTLLANKLSMLDKVYSAGELSYMFHSVGGFLERIPEATQIKIQQVAETYLAMLNDVAVNAIRVIDKMPANFMYVGWILTLFPDAKIIHCKRHPLDICLSNFFTHYESDNKFSYDLNNTAAFFKVYEKLIQYWYKLFSNNIYTIYYENLISNTEQIGKKLVDWLELKWDNNFLHHQNNKNIVYTSSACQVRKKIYTSSVFRWKNYEHLIGEIKTYLSDEIKAYERDLLADASKECSKNKFPI